MKAVYCAIVKQVKDASDDDVNEVGIEEGEE